MPVAARAQDEPLRRKAAVVVDADRQVIGVLRCVLKCGEWDIIHVTDNATVLELGQNQPSPGRGPPVAKTSISYTKSDASNLISKSPTSVRER